MSQDHTLFHKLRNRDVAIRSVMKLEQRHANNPRVKWAITNRMRTIEDLTADIIEMTKRQIVSQAPR